MKKLTTLLSAAIILLSSFAFASDSDNVNARVKAQFENDFSAASNVSWEKTSDFYFATFMLHNIEVNAAYNDLGELVGTSRALEASQLPLNISMEIAKKYDGYKISPRALELTFEGTTRYYVTVENEKQALKLKCLNSGNIEVEKKLKKS